MLFSREDGVVINDQKADLVLRSTIGDAEIITVRMGRNFTNALGGVRFVSNGSLSETARLATGMKEKCLSALVPVDGCKTLVITPDGIPTEDRRAVLLAQHIRNSIRFDSGLIFGPDMGSPESVMGKTFEQLDRKYGNITGLPKEFGGLDIDVNGFTARGVFHAIDKIVSTKGSGSTAMIQGFGEVGSKLAVDFEQTGYKVVAVSNIHGCLANPDGLHVSKLYALYKEFGDACFFKYPDNEGVKHADPNTLFSMKADIFVPAARTSVLACTNELDEVRNENPDVRSVEDFLSASGVFLIAEAANHPLSFEAEKYAENLGVVVLPDFIVNCGGMVGCYTEWKYRDDLLSKARGYDEVVELCNRHLVDTIGSNLSFLLLDANRNFRLSAESIMTRNLDILIENEDAGFSITRPSARHR